MENARAYNDPVNSNPSDIGPQINNHYYQKKALVEVAKEQYFTQLADVFSMPKHFGKKIKRFVYLPMLDDANVNDQGIDAAGVVITTSQYYVTLPGSTIVVPNADKASAASAINDNIDLAGAADTIATAGANDSGGVGFAEINVTKRVVKFANVTKASAVTTLVPGATSAAGSGNLYGSSKDIGTISGKLPTLTEHGGRVNRVGYTRREIEGTFEKFGFFQEYTQESLDFDTDAELAEHINREMLFGANETTEDALQVDLLSSAGVVKYAGTATSNSNVKHSDVVTYRDLMNLSIDLDNNRTAKHTKVITGSRMVDTKVIPACRVAYIGSELIPTFRAMTDLHSAPAFVPLQHYAAAGNTVRGEIGAVDALRIVVVPEMLKWAGEGAAGNGTTYQTGGRVDVFPILVVGNESFTTIGFQTDGKSVKFKIYHKAPGEKTADRNDPYGETGFKSIKWYYGFMALRPERIGLIKTAAKL